MQKNTVSRNKVVLPLLILGIVLAGLAYASPDSVNAVARAFDNPNLNSTCTVNSITLSIGSSANCGNWTVKLNNITAKTIELENEQDNNQTNTTIDVATFSVWYNKTLVRNISLDSNDTGRACAHLADEVPREDEGMGRNHNCILIRTDTVVSTSATIGLRGIHSLRMEAEESFQEGKHDLHQGAQDFEGEMLGAFRHLHVDNESEGH